MNSIHIALLAVAFSCLAASAAGGSWLGRSGTENGRQVQVLSLVIGAALAIGNVVCLMPSTPGWYSVTMIVATAAGMVWLLVTLAGARNAHPGASRHPLQDDQAPLIRPMRLVRGTAVATPTRTAAGSATPAGVVTGDMIYDGGPAGSRAASSQSVYVAANLGVYVPADRQPRRRYNSGFTPRHARPEHNARHLHVARAYQHPVEEQPRSTRSTMA
ncbi:MAG TPA: hypothetical protein VES01_06960 [Dermatophilaceae bacterium]|nr:hypothetical protein [Dermatophilaceae bacterium]